MRQKFIIKCVRFFITKCDSFLENATVITNCDDFITKCDGYYKMRRLLQIATVQPTHSCTCGKNLVHLKLSWRLWKYTLLKVAITRLNFYTDFTMGQSTNVSKCKI